MVKIPVIRRSIKPEDKLRWTWDKVETQQLPKETTAPNLQGRKHKLQGITMCLWVCCHVPNKSMLKHVVERIILVHTLIIGTRCDLSPDTKRISVFKWIILAQFYDSYFSFTSRPCKTHWQLFTDFMSLVGHIKQIYSLIWDLVLRLNETEGSKWSIWTNWDLTFKK